MKSEKKPAGNPAAAADLPEHILALIERTHLAPRPQSALITVLQKVQEHYGYLSPARLDAVAHLMQIPTA